MTWTGVTAPDLMARRTLSLILAPCSRTAMLTSSFTACLTYLTIVSSRLQASHTFHCFTSFQNIYLLLYQYTYLYVYSIILFALLNFLKFKVKVKVFYMPKTLSNIVLMTKAYNVTLFNCPIHQLFRFCWVIFAVDRFKFLKNNYININSAKLGTSQFSGANFLNS